jgi:OOP family OmpA-OmpF porin
MVMEFDQNKADVKPEYDGELRKVAKYMTANPKVTATVEGHTANLKGTPEQLLEVSKLRAQNVVEYLVNTLGVDRARLNAVGYGDDRRLAYNSSAEGKQENRRVNIVFNYPK